MANWIVTIVVLNCFEELISSVKFVKLTVKSIYGESTFTNSIEQNTQQRGKERTNKENPTKREDQISSQKNKTQSESQKDKVNSIHRLQQNFNIEN